MKSTDECFSLVIDFLRPLCENNNFNQQQISQNANLWFVIIYRSKIISISDENYEQKKIIIDRL